MKYYKDTSGQVFGYTDKQASRGQVPDGLIEITEAEKDVLTAPAPAPDCTQITKLQAVRYFQNNGVWPDIKAAIASDEDVSDRWDATTVLVIDDADVLALASVAEALTGKDVQTMFNEAREL